jgi:methionine synthase II (cobalamin-independent)
MARRTAPLFRADHVGSLLRRRRRAQAPNRRGLQYVPLDQLCLSPQCGFSSTVGGSHLTIDDQRRKLELIVETAADVWG